MSNAAPQFVPDDADADAAEIAQLRAAIEEARTETESVPHEVVREWLLALARGERPPPPLP